jgi:hypothetical protein
MANGGLGSAAMLEVLAQTSEVVALRKAGLSLAKVADTTGLPVSKVRDIMALAVAGYSSAIAEDIEFARRLELAYLDQLYQKPFAEATDEDKPLNVKAIEACRGIGQDRARLLGLAKPTQVETTISIQEVLPSEDRVRAAMAAYLNRMKTVAPADQPTDMPVVIDQAMGGPDDGN